ncbi:histone H3.v1-like isoform X2 [Saccostrea cucullata]|uniref:histone H3.v1-like isoform X2 n=1 Tax=Saccostrea cuccullata TaxID=36930 RepID=UPI002ED009F0
MATGDLTNNIRKLQKELKIMKYQESLDLNGLAQGKASALLPIYHYAFTTYSCSIAELIASTDTELYTKTDLRFMEGCYKILRDLFHYKPPVTKEQFFNNGFVERKIIMCTEVMKLIQLKNKSLQPQKKAPTTTTSNLGQVVSMKPSKTKVTDQTQVRPNSSRRSRSSLDTYSSQREGLPDTKNAVVSPRSLTDFDPHQVVNELLQPAENIPKHTAHHVSNNRLLDNHSPTKDADTSSSSESSDQVITQRSPPVHVASVTSPPRVTKEVLPSAGRNVRGFNWAVVTPSIAKTRSSIPFSSDIPGHAQFCLEEDEEEEEEEEEEDGIETVMAATPAHSIMEPHNGETIETERNHNSNPQQPQAGQANQQMLNETHILKAIEQLTKCFGTLESGLTRSIESLNARMILVENRVSMMESKIEAVLAGSQRKEEPTLPQPTNHNGVPQRSAVSGVNTNLQGQGQQNYNMTEITRPPSSSTLKSKADNPITVSGQERNSTEPQQITTNHTTEKSPKYKAPPYQSALYDDSTLVMFSPIRHVAGTPHQHRTPETTFCSNNNDTTDPRRSSTPQHNTVEMDTQIVLGESMNLPTGDTDTQSQVNRIKNLFKSTEVMLKN